MRTTLDIPEELFQQAMELTKVRTKTQAVVMALEELINKKRREGLIALKGTWDIDPEILAMRKKKR